ncbi:TPA: hypothetical protein GF678_11560 [Escherichia coli]|nr:hypothetical protein [Escherichia coli]HAH2855854.1 hypothetical protein [Escherichia coli]
MQRKTLLSACIALALSGQGWAADITEVETTTGEKKNTNVTCPADPGKLSPEELKRLPSECSPLVEQNLMPWLSTGAAALITALAVVELNDEYRTIRMIRLHLPNRFRLIMTLFSIKQKKR